MQGLNRLFLDVTLGAFGMFLILLVIILPFINPPTKIEESVTLPGNLLVEIFWQDNIPVDIDLWVKGPGERPVGYSNVSQRLFNLLRDDLGTAGDLEPSNVEHTYSRGLLPGEYIINVHLYSDSRSNKSPVVVTVQVSIKHGNSGKTIRVLQKQITLKRLKEEVTVYRFMLDNAGNLIKSSVNDFPIKIRTEKKRWAN